MELRCPACRESLDLPLSYFASRDEPPKTLREIEKHPTWVREPCGHCGKITARTIKPRVP
jgi:hypothetical protein